MSQTPEEKTVMVVYELCTDPIVGGALRQFWSMSNTMRRLVCAGWGFDVQSGHVLPKLPSSWNRRAG